MIFENVEKLFRPEGEVVKIAHGSAVLWERPEIPLAYQRVDYIASDGNQYIDTGVLASDYTDRITYDLKMALTALTASKHNYFYGCLYEGKRSGNVCIPSTNTSRIYAFCGDSGAVADLVEAPGINNDFTLSVSTSPLVSTVSGVYNGNNFEITGQATGTMPSANIWLFACNLNGAPTSGTSAPCTAKLYSFSMTKADGTPIRNFVPCYRKSDNVIGLYDTVGGMFYTNKGTRSFTKGADV